MGCRTRSAAPTLDTAATHPDRGYEGDWRGGDGNRRADEDGACLKSGWAAAISSAKSHMDEEAVGSGGCVANCYRFGLKRRINQSATSQETSFN